MNLKSLAFSFCLAIPGGALAQGFVFPVGNDPLIEPTPCAGQTDFCISRRWGALRASDRAPHTGVDLTNNREGDEVRSITDGTVQIAWTAFQSGNGNPDNGYGNVIMIRHDLAEGTFYSVYGHLQDGSMEVSAGQTVTRGQRIGRVDCTGRIEGSVSSCPSNGRTGSHLHFAVKRFPDGVSPILGCGYLSTECNSERGVQLLDRYLNPLEFVRNRLFDFALNLVTVDGNILGRGQADGTTDFVDDFSDGSLTSPPTSAFSFTQGRDRTTESGGFLHFSSADGSRTGTRFGATFLEDLAFLDHLLTDRGGNSQITAAFRADVPSTGQYYAIGIQNAGSPLRESIAISVVLFQEHPWVIVNDHTGTILASDPVSLPTGGFVHLRLFVDDATNRVFASYSLDNGNTYRRFAQHGTIFNVTPGAAIFAQGGVRTPIQQQQ